MFKKTMLADFLEVEQHHKVNSLEMGEDHGGQGASELVGVVDLKTTCWTHVPAATEHLQGQLR